MSARGRAGTRRRRRGLPPNLLVLIDKGHHLLQVRVKAPVDRTGESRVLQLAALVGGEPLGHLDRDRDGADPARARIHMLLSPESETGQVETVAGADDGDQAQHAGAQGGGHQIGRREGAAVPLIVHRGDRDDLRARRAVRHLDLQVAQIPACEIDRHRSSPRAEEPLGNGKSTSIMSRIMSPPVRCTFFLAGEDLESLSRIDPDRDWRELQTGERAWILQTWLRLRCAGHPVELSGTAPEDGLVVFHAKQARELLRQRSRLRGATLVAARADNRQPRIAGGGSSSPTGRSRGSCRGTRPAASESRGSPTRGSRRTSTRTSEPRLGRTSLPRKGSSGSWMPWLSPDATAWSSSGRTFARWISSSP